MRLPDLVAAARAAAEPRFEVAERDDVVEQLLHLIEPESAEGKHVLRLRRQRSGQAGWRTVLLFESQDHRGLERALAWAASTRTHLHERETADLYLFLLADHLPIVDRQRFETEEAFCRRFVVQDEERPEDFLARTFLGATAGVADLGALTAPVPAALRQLAAAFPWLTTPVQEAWSAALLSGTQGSGLHSALIDAVPRTSESA